VRSAFAFLTVIPLRGDLESHATAYFPIAGAVLGILVAAADLVLTAFLPTPVASVLDIALLAALSGGLHLDGLADSADGLFLLATRERRLAVMADSRTGAFGTAAVVLVLVAEVTALSSVPSSARAAVLVAGVALSRWSMSYLLGAFPAAKTDGLAASMRRATRTSDLVVGTIIAILLGAATLGVDVLSAFGVAALVATAGGAFARSRIGGVTGDICGGVGEVVFAGQLVLASGFYR